MYEDDEYDEYDEYDDNYVEQDNDSSSDNSSSGGSSVRDNINSRIKDKVKGKVKGSLKPNATSVAKPPVPNPAMGGATGATGATGTAGAAGATGTAGAAGATGTAGAAGAAGATGTAGVAGAAGAAGTAGAAGAAGTAGVAGAAGAAGTAGVAGAASAIAAAASAAAAAASAAVSAIVAAIAAALPIILIIIIIIVLVFGIFAIIAFLAGNWDTITRSWGYLWSGSAGVVNQDDVSSLYYNLMQQGVDLQQIGAVGEHSYINSGLSFIDKPELHEKAEQNMDKYENIKGQSAQIRSTYTLQYWLDRVKADPSLKDYMQVNKSKTDYIKNSEEGSDEFSSNTEIETEIVKDSNGNPILETDEDAAARLLSERIVEFTNDKFPDDHSLFPGRNKISATKGIGLYLNRYLVAEQETFSVRNNFTFSEEGYRGGIFISNGHEDDEEQNFLTAAQYMLTTNAWNMLGDIIGAFAQWTGQNYPITKSEDGSTFYLPLTVKQAQVDSFKSVSSGIVNDKYELKYVNVKKDYDITNWVYDYAMPWQYPFAFHEHTNAPDVGYEVALMAHKYHDLQINVRMIDKGRLIVIDPEKNERVFDEPIKEPKLFLKSTSTWYEKTEYDYRSDPGSSWHEDASGSKEADILGYGKAQNYDALNNIRANVNFQNDYIPENVEEPIRLIIINEDVEYRPHCNRCSGITKDNNVWAETWTGTIPKQKQSIYNELIGHHEAIYEANDCDCDLEDGDSCTEDHGEHIVEQACDCYLDTIYTYSYEYRYIYNGEYIYEENPIVTIEDNVPSKQSNVKIGGYQAMTELLFPDIKFNPVTGESNATESPEPVKYYKSNKIYEQKDASGTLANVLNANQTLGTASYYKDYLAIGSSYELILKTLYDLYSKTPYVQTVDEGNVNPTELVKKENEGQLDTYLNSGSDVLEGSDQGTPRYLSLEGNYKPVIELIMLFHDNGLIDDESIGGSTKIESYVVNAEWFIEGDQCSIAARTNNGQQIAVIKCGSGREVTAPMSGRITKVEGTDYICISNSEFGSIYLNNINLSTSGSVSKGQVIGTSTGDVSYYRVDSAGQAVKNPSSELNNLQEVNFSDYVWPVPDSVNITSYYGNRADPITKAASFHHGIDIGAAAGTTIVAYADGEIYKTGFDKDGYGNYVIIKHSDGLYTLYAHMNSIKQTSGAITKNSIVGYVGSTGRSTGPHLHFEIRTGNGINSAINPLSKLKNYK